MSTQAIVTVILYLTASVLLGLRFKDSYSSSSSLRHLFNLSGLIALVLHAHLLYSSIIIANGLDFGFFNVVSLVGWLVAMIVMATSFFRPLENLLIVLFPIAVLAILLESFIPDERLITDTLSTGLKIHILLSICAYSLLMIGTIQALILAVQEKMIKAKHAATIMNILPPLQIMENLLIQLIVIGYFLLSLSLASGLMFISDLFAQHLVHKTVLSIVAWIIYTILLWGRWSAGWRGQKIIRWAVGGFIALLLAYFGSKFVLELILQRV
ncbi:MAG: cytochrome c biogenesis protein CcsA [Proteobacteria bacterium]|nr:cytochrome c biogenesis protein CcsA [Pseudomonadota bacterium]